MKAFFKGFLFAIRGIWFAISERNFKVHLFASIVVIVAGFYFKISREEWLAVIICIGLVISAETMNTAIETLTDLVSPEFNQKAGKAKDLAAGAVLITAIISLIVAIFIFIPKFRELFSV